MEIDTETVLKIARLSRIKINEGESADIQKDLNRIVEFVKKLGEIDIDGIDEFNFGKTNIEHMRKDSVTILTIPMTYLKIRKIKIKISLPFRK